MWNKSIDDIATDSDHKNSISKESDDTNSLSINDFSCSMYYPISDDFLRQKRRWKFREWLFVHF